MLLLLSSASSTGAAFVFGEKMGDRVTVCWKIFYYFIKVDLLCTGILIRLMH